jgi:hypothetical protein
MAYNDGRFMSFCWPRTDGRGNLIDRIEEIRVPHSRWREEVAARKHQGATYAASFRPFHLPQSTRFFPDPLPEDVAIIQYRVPAPTHEAL